MYLRIEEGGEPKEEEPPIEAEPSAEPEDMLLAGVIVVWLENPGPLPIALPFPEPREELALVVLFTLIFPAWA